MTDSPAEKTPSAGTKVLKWIGIATAVISLVLGGNQVLKLVNEKRKALAQQEKAMVLVKTAKGQVGMITTVHGKHWNGQTSLHPITAMWQMHRLTLPCNGSAAFFLR